MRCFYKKVSNFEAILIAKLEKDVGFFVLAYQNF